MFARGFALELMVVVILITELVFLFRGNSRLAAGKSRLDLCCSP
jgi:hypothetical protein